MLADGTPCYAPVGEVWADEASVCCHLCGRWYASVVSHLRAHRWSRAEYVAAFGLEHGVRLESARTAERRAASFIPRRRFEPAVRAGAARGVAAARAGELTRAAQRANTGRAHPAQRRGKTMAALGRISPQRQAVANRDRARRDLAATAARVAAEQGCADIGTYALRCVAAGQSLAAASRAAGLSKDWLQRHLGTVAPAAAGRIDALRHERTDLRLQFRLGELGLGSVPEYLQRRHIDQRQTVRAMAVELGVSRALVEAALARHGIARTAHADRRSATIEREQKIAAWLGADTLQSHVDSRRADGWSYAAIAAECAVPASWLQRRLAVWAR